MAATFAQLEVVDIWNFDYMLVQHLLECKRSQDTATGYQARSNGQLRCCSGSKRRTIFGNFDLVPRLSDLLVKFKDFSNCKKKKVIDDPARSAGVTNGSSPERCGQGHGRARLTDQNKDI